MRRSVASAAVLSALAAAIMTALSMLCMRPLLTLMHTPAAVFADAYVYIMVLCGGIAAQVAYNLLASPAAWILADILLLTAYPIVLRQQEAAHCGDRPAAQPLPQRA